MSIPLIDSDDLKFKVERKISETYVFPFMEQDGTIKISAKQLMDLAVTMLCIGIGDS